MRCLNPRLCYFVSTTKNKAPNFSNQKRQHFTASRFLASFTLVTSLLFPFINGITIQRNNATFRLNVSINKVQDFILNIFLIFLKTKPTFKRKFCLVPRCFNITLNYMDCRTT